MKRWITPCVTVAVLIVALGPLLWMIDTSLKTNLEIGTGSTLYPHAPTVSNYGRLFSQHAFGSFLRNSLIVCLASVGVSLIFGSLAAYVMARFRLRYRLETRIGMGLLVGRIIPGIAIVVPLYLLVVALGLLNTLLGLIIIYTAFNLTFVVWMMESFFEEIPVDLEEAAMVDGDSRFSAFRRIVLPLTAPGLAATSIFAVIVTFNEFLFALILTNSPAAQTLPAGTATLIGRVEIDWGAMGAAGVVGAIPIVIFALMVQRHLVRGLTLGALK